jgi:hypothetical protein
MTWVLLGVLLVLATPAGAAPVFFTGWDTCDEREAADLAALDEGGTAGLTTVGTNAVRTGRCGLRVALTANGENAYHQVNVTADADLYSRIAIRSPTGLASGQQFLNITDRAVFGFLQGDNLGCHVRPYFDNVTSTYGWTLAFGDKPALGTVTGATIGVFDQVELHQRNESAPGCGGGCQVTCELFFRGGPAKISALQTQINGANFGNVTAIRAGFWDSVAQFSTLDFDDWHTDDADPVDVGKVLPLTPDGETGTVTWTTTGCTIGSEADCTDDYASGVDDGDTSYVDSSIDTQVVTFTLTNPTFGDGETAFAARAFAVSRGNGTNTPRTHQVRLDFGGGNTLTSAATDDLACSTCTYAIRESVIGWPAGVVNGDLAGTTLRLMKTSAFTIRTTAVLAYVAIREPRTIGPRNLQDKDADGRVTLALLGDRALVGETAGGIGQQLGLTFDQVNSLLVCGLPSATTAHLNTIAGLVRSGADLVRKRYCQNKATLTSCTPDVGSCTSRACASVDCAAQSEGAANCWVACWNVTGTKLCQNDRTKPCNVNADCPASPSPQECDDYPAADYVVVMPSGQEFWTDSTCTTAHAASTLATVKANLATLNTTIVGSAPTRRPIWLVPPQLGATACQGGWGATADELLAVRAHLLDAYRPLADGWYWSKTGETPIIGTAAWRLASPDTNGLTTAGTAALATRLDTYLHQLQPRCSNATGTTCGRCSVTTATVCDHSDDCPIGEACTARDAVCTGGGTCTAEGVGQRCSRDVATVCTTNADCSAGKGTCRDDGILAVGDG